MEDKNTYNIDEGIEEEDVAVEIVEVNQDVMV